jgi:diacylglycerol kinase (ATP)
MIIFVNPRAGGGNAMRRWRMVAPDLKQCYPRAETCIGNAPADVAEMIGSYIKDGHSHFVAAGGDGSINTLVNAVMTLPPDVRRTITVGAIGLGSSNDFHKPIHTPRLVAGIPCMMDPRSARPRDVGIVHFESGKGVATKYFLINASVGLTADANSYFNLPGRFLALLKCRSTPLAIALAAMRTIFTYRDKATSLSVDSLPPSAIRLTNLALLKSPFISGSLRFPTAMETDSGEFSLFVAHDMQLADRFRLLRGLLCGSLRDSDRLHQWQAPCLSLSAEEPFAVEYDGEVVRTQRATFAIIQKHLQVCTC